MRYFTGFIILIFMHSCASKNQEIIRDENDNIILKCELKNGFRHGKCYHYFPNGATKAISIWITGVREGESIGYFENGSVHSTQMWKDGKQDGKRVEYFENGSIKQTSMWKEDKVDGECFEYFENGGEKVRSYFINDQRIHDEFYDEVGRKQKEYHYITVNHQLRLNGLVIYDTDNSYNYPNNINFQESMHARIIADRDTIDYGGFAEYEVAYWCENDDIYVRVFTGNIDHNFNVDPSSIKPVDLDNKNRFYPSNLGTDTLRVIFDFIIRKDGESRTFSSYLEEVFAVSEK